MVKGGVTHPCGVASMLCWTNCVFSDITLLMSRSRHPVGRACKDYISVDELGPFVGSVVTGYRLGGSRLWVQCFDALEIVLGKAR